MSFFEILILGMIEGVTEFLPISSTGHLILTARLLNLQQSEFLKSFEIAIQLGAILAVVALYGKSLLVRWEVIKRVGIAFLPTAVIGFLLYKFIKRFLLGSDTVVLWALLWGGIFILVFEYFHREKMSDPDDLAKLPYAKAFGVGVCQSLAVIPGVSRAAATILGGLALGIPRKTIVEFSFLLAVPTMLAATALDLFENGASFGADELIWLLIGSGISFIVAILSIRFLLSFIRNHTFTPFGIYRIVLTLVFWLW